MRITLTDGTPMSIDLTSGYPVRSRSSATSVIVEPIHDYQQHSQLIPTAYLWEGWMVPTMSVNRLSPGQGTLTGPYMIEASHIYLTHSTSLYIVL